MLVQRIKSIVRRWPAAHVALQYLRYGKRLDPLRVSHADAVRFFERNRADYERLAGAVAAEVPPRGVWLDVGANIGFFSRILMERVGFAGTAHLFEPLPHLAALCRETFRDLPYDVTVHDFGLSDRDGEAVLHTAGNGNIGWNTVVGERRQPGMEPVTVRMRRFDSLGLPLPDFAKIDVEGAEYQVIEGMLPALRSAAFGRLPVILCEVGWGRRHPRFAEEQRAFAALAEIGYVATDLAGRPVVLADLAATTDVVFRAGARG